MNFLLMSLPSDPRKIASIPSRISTILDHTNPGTSKPSSFSSPRLSVDQTKTVSIASASAVNSDGMMQLKDLRPGQQGVLVSAGSNSGESFSGDRQRSGALANLDQGTQVEVRSGLPINFYPGDQNFSAPIVGIAKTTPIAVSRDGGRGVGKGLNLPVMIR